VPTYSAAARAVNAQGRVSVKVVVNEQGRVVSADVVSGHPLLREAAERAARQARFSPTLLSGEPVSVMGTIVYNFTG
jgi:protein TonB